MTRTIASILAAAALCGAPAFAQTQPTPAAMPTTGPEAVRGGMFDASDPLAIRRFMEDSGYRAELLKSAEGEPMIRGRLSRTDYVIQFYECENGAFCNSIQFLAAAARPASVTLEQVNDFNGRWRYARASASGSELRLQLDVNLDAGVTAANLEDTLDIWRQLVEFFERDLLRLGSPAPG